MMDDILKFDGLSLIVALEKMKKHKNEKLEPKRNKVLVPGFKNLATY